MLTRRLAALSLLLVVPSVARAGAVVELVPSASGNAFNPCGAYAAGELVTVDIWLSQSPAGANHYLRMVQLDTGAGDITPDSVTWMATTNHFALVDGAKYSNTYHGDLDPVTPDLGLNITDQFLLPGDGTSVMVGSMQVTMPGTPGSFTLNVLNTGSAGADESAQLRYGYGLTGTEAITAWRANSSDLTGGSFTFDVINQNLAAATPDDQHRLWRSQNNIWRLTFDTDLAAAPAAGEVEIREMMAGGGLGADLSASFTFTVENDGGGLPRILKIQEIGPQLTHRTWYATINTGAWASATPFEVQYLLQVGDADDNGLVLALDAGVVFTGIPCFIGCADDDRRDIDGDGRIISLDAGVIYGMVPSFGVTRPSGHDCQ